MIITLGYKNKLQKIPKEAYNILKQTSMKQIHTGKNPVPLFSILFCIVLDIELYSLDVVLWFICLNFCRADIVKLTYVFYSSDNFKILILGIPSNFFMLNCKLENLGGRHLVHTENYMAVVLWVANVKSNVHEVKYYKGHVFLWTFL